MNLIENVILKSFDNRLALLQYLATIVQFFFVPFFGILIGGTFLSLHFKKKGERENDRIFINLSKDVIVHATISKGAAFALGIIPLAGLIIVFENLLFSLPLPTVTFLILSFLLFIAGIAFVYTYRYSLSFSAAAEGIGAEGELKDLHNASVILSNKSGLWGILFLLFASFFYVAGITQAYYPNHWDGMSFASGLFVSGLVIFKWIYFILCALSVAGAYLLFMNFFWEGGNKNLANEEIKYFSGIILKLIYITMMIIPLFVLINLYTLPDGVLTTGLFGISFFAIFIVLAVLSLIFRVFSGASLNKSGWIFVLVLLAMFLLTFGEITVIFLAAEKELVLQVIK